jgi:hypothetical protein
MHVVADGKSMIRVTRSWLALAKNIWLRRGRTEVRNGSGTMGFKNSNRDAACCGLCSGIGSLVKIDGADRADRRDRIATAEVPK